MLSLKRSPIALPLLTAGLAMALLAGMAAAPTSSQASWTPPSFLDTSFNPDANGVVNEVLVQSNGKILIGGAFTTVGGATRERVARLNADGTVDNTFADPGANGIVRSIALQADGKILIGGEFTQVGGQTRNKIARLNADGTLDTSFDIGSLTGAFGGQPVIDAISVLSDGKILIGGYFSSITPPAGSQVIRAATARLDSDGIIDTSYTGPLAAGDRVWTLEVLSGGKILTGAQTATAANRLVLTDANGTRDSSFVNPNPNEQVFDVAVQSDGKILAGGLFTSIAGETRNRLARLNADGTLDTGFDPNVSSAVESVSLRADGKILVGGRFTSIGGNARTRVAILNADGTVNDAFFPTVGGDVYSAVSQADGNILIGGAFTTVEGQTRNRVARVFPALPPAAPANTSPPTVSGTAEVGQTLTANIGDWTGYPEPNFTYQWQRCEESGTYSPAILGSTGSNPFGIVVDPTGNVYVANYGGSTVTKLLPNGSAAGSPWPVTVGTNPAGLALDSAGNVYSVNFGTRDVSKITPAGSVSTLGATGPDPYSLALDSTGNVFTANNDASGSGAGSVTKIPTSGSPSNLGSTGPGSYPRAIAVDSAGSVYTANYGTNNITKITAAGNVTTSWASTGAASGPYGIAVDSNGNVYTANLGNDTVSKLLPDGSAAGGPWPVLISPGSGPHALAIDSAGNVFTANGYSSNVTKITPDGTPTTIASAGSYPQGIALDSAGNVYTSNYSSNNVTKLTAGVTCTDISGADDPTYALTGADEGKKIRVKVSGTNSQGSASANSAPSATVAPQPPAPPANTASPAISGEAKVGEKLTADPGEWSGSPTPTFTYQWQRCDASGSNCVNISGATTNEYTLTAADEGSRIRVVVTATNSQGTATANSEPSASVPVPGPGPGPGPDPAPTPSGKPKLRISVTTPKKIRAGKGFPVKVKTSNVAQAPLSTSTRSGTTASDVRTCARLPKGIFVVKSGRGKVEKRTICWTRSSLAAGRSVTYKATVRSSKTMAGSMKVSGTASASNGSGATVKASGSSKVRVVEPKQPKPKPPTG